MRSSFRQSKIFLLNNWVFFFPLIVSILAGFLLFIYSKQAPNLNKVLHSSLSFRDAAPWGQLGDFFGGILNPIISLFTLLIAAMVWKLQKRELRETHTAIQRQTTDQFFMGMLEAHRSMTAQVTYINSDGNTLHSGKRAVDSYLKKLDSGLSEFDVLIARRLRYIQDTGRQDPNYDPYANNYVTTEQVVAPEIAFAIQKTYEVHKLPSIDALPYFSYFCVRYYSRYWEIDDYIMHSDPNELSFEQIFGHIFRSTYQILKLIDEEFSDETSVDLRDAVSNNILKKRYINLLRAQMSEAEFIFFALSAITKDGRKSWARAVRLNFFEDRLQNQEWTKGLSTFFSQSTQNLNEASLLLKDE